MIFLYVITSVTMEKVEIRRVGNSLGIILPKNVLDLMGLSDGDEIQIGVANNSVQVLLKKDKSTDN